MNGEKKKNRTKRYKIKIKSTKKLRTERNENVFDVDLVTGELWSDKFKQKKKIIQFMLIEFNNERMREEKKKLIEIIFQCFKCKTVFLFDWQNKHHSMFLRTLSHQLVALDFWICFSWYLHILFAFKYLLLIYEFCTRNLLYKRLCKCSDTNKNKNVILVSCINKTTIATTPDNNLTKFYFGAHCVANETIDPKNCENNDQLNK